MPAFALVAGDQLELVQQHLAKRKLIGLLKTGHAGVLVAVRPGVRITRGRGRAPPCMEPMSMDSAPSCAALLPSMACPSIASGIAPCWCAGTLVSSSAAKAGAVPRSNAPSSAVDGQFIAGVFIDHHLAEHARSHVIQQVAVEGPAPRRVGAHGEAHALCGLHRHGVLAHLEPSVPRPHETFHVAGQVQLQFPLRLAAIEWTPGRAQIGVG